MGEGRDEKGKFISGHKESEKWTEEKAVSVFKNAVNMVMSANQVHLDILTNKKTGDKKIFINPDGFYLSLQQVVIELDNQGIIPYSTFHYLVGKYPILDTYKKQIQESIIATINVMALTGNANPTAAIWQRKQMGETDKQEQDVNLKSNGIVINLKKRESK